MITFFYRGRGFRFYLGKRRFGARYLGVEAWVNGGDRQANCVLFQRGREIRLILGIEED